MKGNVDTGGRSLLRVTLRPNPDKEESTIDVWVDTGFTGDLVLPQSVIESLGLTKSGSVDALLADGSQTVLNTFTCLIEWFGVQRTLEVIANEGVYPLLGVGLLLGLELRIDYRNFTLSLDSAPAE